jgi:hypothetical protein
VQRIIYPLQGLWAEWVYENVYGNNKHKKSI